MALWIAQIYHLEGDSGPYFFGVIVRTFFTSFLLICFAILGAGIGFLIFLRQPDSYSASTRLMLEQTSSSDQENATSNRLATEVVEAKLRSDQVMSAAFSDPRMQPFREKFDNNQMKFTDEANDSLSFRSELSESATDANIFVLEYSSPDPELAAAAVKSFAIALYGLIEATQRNQGEDLMRLITVAIEQLHPKLVDMEHRYRDFRREAPLVWDSDGKAINPHRVRQLELVRQQSEIYEEQRTKTIRLEQIESIAQKSKDPKIALRVIERMLDGKILDRGQTDRSKEPSSSETEDPKARAAESIAVIIYALKAEVDAIAKQLADVKTLVAKEKQAATQLAKYESDNGSMLREIERTQQLIDQLEQQMAKVSLAGGESQIRITELNSTKRARLAGSMLVETMGIGAACGLILGFIFVILPQMASSKSEPRRRKISVTETDSASS